ncbi:sulfite oxidase [Winogradskya consettensis]|uniref:Oxidoreductase n=1 Tax=Winogradskya consettensis TaxID=113560 RepID=A0A919VLC8_9ACTN|nr:molybdopterin-dependent oxidoreductase [Actinoplanes consettensis]GIM67694.1 oxidoreductase [Actinoplanes consettensis]
MKLTLRAGLAGIAAAAVAVGLAEIVAVFTGPLSSPLLAVGGVVVDHVPAPVKDFGISVFGTHDKTALITGTAILLAVYAGLVGIVALRSWLWAYAGIALFAVIGVSAAVTRHDAGVFAALPSLIAAAVAIFALRRLVPLAEAVEPVDSDSRRRFLVGVGIVAGVGVVGGFAGRLFTSSRAVTEARKSVVLPKSSAAVPTVPAGAQVAGATPYVSSNESFYRIDTSLYPPQVDPATWQLRIHGMVRNPITITWEQLLQRQMVERYVTLACVSNEVGGDLIGNALWLGTALKDLLDEADPLPDADQAVARSVDGWTCGSPTAVLRDGRDALLAIGMNGQPLPVEHGFPVRMVVPGLYGYVSACKWVTEIELTRFTDFDAYWVPRGWSALGPIKTESRIDTPKDGAKRPAGQVMIAGVAWAQHRGISKVEVQVDDNAWEAATLAPAVSADTWVQWSYAWQGTKGDHRIQVRATDAEGQTQTEEGAPPAPDGATGWHSVEVTVD